jgi:3-hydroxyacyl-CoA dehydrogenase/enoyl-CoA hydratase/3-hydroxybutyryl-CoA epimerase
MFNTYRNWQCHLADDGILNLGLDKLDASTNTLNVDIFEELAQILSSLANLPQVKGLIIYSLKSSGFIAGADIEQFTKLDTVDAAFDLIRRGQCLYDQLAALPIPTVALIDGFCLGGGLELALACRYRVATDSSKTRLGLPEVMIGIHPGWGGCVRLPALIGSVRAMDLVGDG